MRVSGETTRPWGSLAARVDGALVLPEDPSYEWARKPFIARFDDVLPQAVLRCAGPHDVVEAIGFARHHGIAVVPRSGGHCFAGYSSTDGLLLDVSPMTGVRVDGEHAVVVAGTRVGELSRRLAALGRVVPSGSCPTVGVAGTTLGGGLGVLGRLYGLTCDHLVEAEVVLADGRVVVVDAEREPDLHWALRGAGGGHFGVVTAFTFRTRPTPRMTNFYYVWPYADAARVMDAWQTWAPFAAEDRLRARAHRHRRRRRGAVRRDLRRDGRLGGRPARRTRRARGPRRLATPGGLAAGARVRRDGAVPGRAAHGRQHGRRDARGPGGASGAPLHQVGVLRRADPARRDRRARPRVRERAVARRLPRPRVRALGRGVRARRGRRERVRPPLLPVLAQARDPRGPRGSDERKHAGHRWVTRSWASVHPWGSGAVYPNFPDPDIHDYAGAYFGANLARLQRVKRRYDPDGFFSRPQPIPTG